MTSVDRHILVWKYFDRMTDADLMQLGLVKLMTPDEAKRPWGDATFFPDKDELELMLG